MPYFCALVIGSDLWVVTNSSVPASGNLGLGSLSSSFASGSPGSSSSVLKTDAVETSGRTHPKQCRAMRFLMPFFLKPQRLSPKNLIRAWHWNDKWPQAVAQHRIAVAPHGTACNAAQKIERLAATNEFVDLNPGFSTGSSMCHGHPFGCQFQFGLIQQSIWETSLPSAIVLLTKHFCITHWWSLYNIKGTKCDF